MFNRLTSRVYPLRIPFPPDEEAGWKPYAIFEGCTANLYELSCHVSVLTKGHCPHQPHRHHDQEELLLLLSGEVDLILPDAQEAPVGLKPGEFVYYPANFAHTLRTVSKVPANYLMLKWSAAPTGLKKHVPFGRFRASGSGEPTVGHGPFQIQTLFEGSTAFLRRLHCHTSVLEPGAGYKPHRDEYDVAIVVLEGQVETLEERVEPYGVIFYPAGEPHGLRNTGEGPARYIVFEFHGRATALARVRARQMLKQLARLVTPAPVRRRLRRFIDRHR
jgi:quercetin dioxygenase-like cupin family protein